MLERLKTRAAKFLLIDYPGLPVEPTLFNYFKFSLSIIGIVCFAFSLLLMLLRISFFVPLLFIAVAIFVLCERDLKKREKENKLNFLEEQEKRQFKELFIEIARLKKQQEYSEWKEQRIVELSANPTEENIRKLKLLNTELQEPGAKEINFQYFPDNRTFDVIENRGKTPVESLLEVEEQARKHEAIEVTLKRLQSAFNKDDTNFSSLQTKSKIPKYVLIADEDPGSALSCVRRDLEIELRRIARSNRVAGCNKYYTDLLLPALLQKKILKAGQVRELTSLNKLLNRVVHGSKYSEDCSAWLTQDWPILLKSLKNIGGNTSDDQPADVTLANLKRASIGIDNFEILDAKFKPPMYVSIAKDDPGAALTCARRDLEIKLQELSRKSKLPDSGIEIGGMLKNLEKTGSLTSSQANLLGNVSNQLNKAIHGAICSADCRYWLEDEWPSLLIALDLIKVD